MMSLCRAVPMLFLLIWMSPALAGESGGERKFGFPTPLGYVSDYADLIEPDWQRPNS